ncbi:MAG: enhanced intracellular survival protein Eis [Friedmanniella sp.]
MSLTVRRLELRDAEVARRLGWEAFGVPSTLPTTPATLERPGMTWFGAFQDGALVARMVDRDYHSWFGGALLPTCGIAGVTVVAESRGSGSLTPLFTSTLEHARARGAVISTLFPTAPGIYRRFGYELVADFVTVQLSTAALTAVARPATTTSRRAVDRDIPAIRRLYDGWARAQNGPLSRRGVSFDATAGDLLTGFTGVTVAEDGGKLVGYALWNRGQGYDETSALDVPDLLAATPDGYRALLRVLGSFATVAPTTRIDTSGDDLARLVLPSVGWQVQHSSPYMLRVLDVPGAFMARRYAPALRAELDFTLTGDFLAGLDGSYHLSVADGQAECVRTTESARVLTPRGLALLFAGAQSSANLRTAGHLRGGDREQDLDWDALMGGRQLHIRDYF